MNMVKPSCASRNLLLYEGLEDELQVWMSHGDKVVSMPEGFETVAESDNCPHATMQHLERALFGVQFHPKWCIPLKELRCLKTLLTEFAAAQAIGKWRNS